MRLTNFSELAPAYIEVGELGIFRDESIEYALSLNRAGVSCDLRVHAGAPHGFEWVSPDASVSLQAKEERTRIIQDI